MNDLVVKKVGSDQAPYELLLLADPSMDMINDYINRGNCYVAYVNNNLVGVYVTIRTRPLTLELANIAVSQAYQGKGIGEKLIRSAIDMARKEKAKVLEVGTGNSSISQLALYQRCGFRITGIDRDFFRQHYDEKIIEKGIECIDMIRLGMNL